MTTPHHISTSSRTAKLVRTRMPRLHEALTGERVLTPLDVAYANWRAAQAEYDAAKAVDDDRRVGPALKALRAAQTECVRLEVEARR